jgi:CMP-N-acetylneuraminic acid synthetase
MHFFPKERKQNIKDKMTKNLVAVIPVRAASQRVKNKNFKSFGGKNLLIHKIKLLKKIKQIDDIIVNSDSDKAMKIAKDYKVSFQKREKYFASSKCTNSEFWSHIGETTNGNFIMFTDCTNPLIKEQTYIKIINSFEAAKSKYDSINTVSEVKEFLYLNNKPINFNPNKAPNSQNLPDIIKLNFAINILSTKVMSKKKSLVGYKPLFYKISEIEGYDINTDLEFKFAEFLFKKNI